MPIAFKKTEYYNLVNNTLLNPELLIKYTEEITNLVIVENLQLLTFNLMPIVIETMYKNLKHHPPLKFVKHYFVYNKNRVDFYKVWERLQVSFELQLYYQKVFNRYSADYALIERLVYNNTYKIRDMLSKAMCDAYFIKYVAPSVIRAIAINKIKRNKIYNMGLGLKLAVREYSKDF